MYRKQDWGRMIPVSQREDYRSEPRRDSARLLHSPSFRRLQGKLQLFPSKESDFFRNRLTHSLEVGQIAKSIAIRLNAQEKFLKPDSRKLNVDLVELAGWCHDLGHPPFGHTGEEALNICMNGDGGFEGNAQTLRILTKLEKKHLLHNDKELTGYDNSGEDNRVGLNLTFRSLASILKYDKKIPASKNKHCKIIKGYYSEESDVVSRIKEAILPTQSINGAFKTLECSIMDIADDIAYSTYDLEDAFKAKFLTPFDLFAANAEVVEKVADSVKTRLGENFGPKEVRETLIGIFKELFDGEGYKDPSAYPAVWAYRTSKQLAGNGFYRSNFTSGMVGEFIRSINFTENKECPALSKVELSREALRKVEVLKHFTYQSLILSPDLKMISYRGKEITEKLFTTFCDNSKGGHELLPKDVRSLYESVDSEQKRKRIICDFIAGMTDHYAVEYYGRLTSERPQSLFKPLF